MVRLSVRKFFESEKASGLLLIASALLALLATNSPLSSLYDSFLHLPFSVSFGPLHLSKPLLLWINDGLMAVFFLLIGLEVKREIFEGQLSSISRASLPLVAAVGGMVVPALIYVAINRGDPASISGWAIPAATDIAFSLGILALLGDKVPKGLKTFLLAVAIIDDIGAIAIIALFYSGDLSLISLLLATLVLGILILLNRVRVTRIAPYVILGSLLWVCVLKSGVHATLAGVALAFCIPLKGKDGREPSPLRMLEERLHPWVLYGIMPLFAFANAGVSLSGLTLASLLSPVPLGIGLGLFLGKQAGIFLFSWMAVRYGIGGLPDGVRWRDIYGLSLLCGIGFTMSLFIGSLAFEHGGLTMERAVRLGVLSGTLLSAVTGYFFLKAVLRNNRRGE